MQKPAARLGDQHNCSKDNHDGGEIVEGSPNITINDKPAARVGDNAPCKNGGENPIAVGSATVFFNDKAAARVDDAMTHGGVVIEGSNNVTIGSGGGKVVFGNKGKIIIGTKGKVVIGGRGAMGAEEIQCTSCEEAWRQVFEETDLIASVKDPIERNKKITASYAKLYLQTPELQWLFTATIASKEVGYTMQHKMVSTFFLETLGEGNRAIFQDIYPALRFYSKFSGKKLNECANKIDRKIKKKILNSLEEIAAGKLNGNSMLIKHEQFNIIKPMYEHFAFRNAIKMNHQSIMAATVIDRLSIKQRKELLHSMFLYSDKAPKGTFMADGSYLTIEEIRQYVKTNRIAMENEISADEQKLWEKKSSIGRLEEKVYISVNQETGPMVPIRERDITVDEDRVNYAEEVHAVAVEYINQQPEKVNDICNEMIRRGNQ